MYDNKDVKLLKDKLKTEAEVVIIKKSQVVEGATLLCIWENHPTNYISLL